MFLCHSVSVHGSWNFGIETPAVEIEKFKLKNNKFEIVYGFGRVG